MHRLALVCAAAALCLAPSIASSQCGTGDCATGGLGTGGTSSDGKAQGFHFAGPGRNPGVTVTNSGNSDAGRLEVTRPDLTSSVTGTFRNDTARGRGTGEFGDWTGQCELADFPDEC